MKKILVIGSSNMDLTVYTDRMPKLGETVVGRDFSLNYGGKGANQATAVGKLYGKASFLSAVGNDIYGNRLLAHFEKQNIVYKGIVSDTVPTGTAHITVVNGDNFIVLNSGANDLITPPIIEKNKNLIESADFLIMQLEIPVESVICAAKIAKKANTKVVLNPAPYKKLPEDFYKYTDILIPNEHEASLLTNMKTETHEDCEKVVSFLHGKGVETVIITLGEKGCIYNYNGNILTCPAEKTEVVDTTSAGDSFIGALCAKLAEDEPLPNAVKFATKVSAITVSRYGAGESIPTKDEL